MNHENEGLVGYFPGHLYTSFLSYWNEDMASLDGATDFVYRKIYPILYNYFDWELSDEEKLYVKSTVPQLPVIGYFTPADDHYFYIEQETLSWSMCYCIGDAFSFPQMAFDGDNKLHLTYLGLLNGSGYHHPFHTSTANGGTTWRKTEHLVKNIALIDQEFAYLTLEGIHYNQMWLMAQVDAYLGTYITSPGTSPVCQNGPTDNRFYHFYVDMFPHHPAIENIEGNQLTMNVIPNPASGQATVTFDGTANITIYNMLGQTVYHVENVENEKIIPLHNLSTGVYFVSVRAGNAAATQKLVVK